MDGLAFRQISPELGSPPSPTFLTLLGCAVLGFVNGCPSLDSYLSQSLFRTWSVNGRGFFKVREGFKKEGGGGFYGFEKTWVKDMLLCLSHIQGRQWR